MTASSFSMTWTPDAVERAARLSAESALRSLRVPAEAFWADVVPIETGLLDVSFRTSLKRGRNPQLVISAGGPGAGLEESPAEAKLTGPSRLFGKTRTDAIATIMARMGARLKQAGAYYAYWVETGWTAPNGRWVSGQFPLQRTGLAIARLLPEAIAEASRKRGLGGGRRA